MEEDAGYPFAKNLEEVLQNQLDGGQKRCLEVYIDNERTTLEDALKRCVRESSVYMPDYVLDDNGVLEQLRFDKIDLQ